MRFGAIIAARTGSTRLPGKALLPLMGLPVIVLLLRRIRTSRLLNDLTFATTDLPQDDCLAQTVASEGIRVFRGSAEDVLDRFVQAGKLMEVDYGVRITGDCPFVDGPTLDYVLSQCRPHQGFDLLTTKPAFPHGIDYEVYDKALLDRINRQQLSQPEREHILNHVVDNAERFTIIRVAPPAELVSDLPLFLLDTAEDYERMRRMTESCTDIHVPPSDLIRNGMR